MTTHLNVRDVVDSGLLHVINEAELWPKGHTLVIEAPATCGEQPCTHGLEHVLWDARAILRIDREDEPIVTALTDEEHAARHAAFEQAHPLRWMPDGTPCWCVSETEPHDGWQHAPACNATLRRVLASA